MGATVQTLILEGVNTKSAYSVSCYFAGADAAGYVVPVSQYLAAGAGSPTEFTIPEPCRIKYMTGPATGTLLLLADGVITPIRLPMASILAKAADSDVRWGNLAGSRGGARIKYRLQVEVAMAA
jgi:hypothetical protein